MEMTIEIVDFPSKHGDFPVRYVSHYKLDPNLDLYRCQNCRRTAEEHDNPAATMAVVAGTLFGTTFVLLGIDQDLVMRLMEKPRKSIGQWWFHGILWDIPSGND